MPMVDFKTRDRAIIERATEIQRKALNALIKDEERLTIPTMASQTEQGKVVDLQEWLKNRTEDGADLVGVAELTGEQIATLSVGLKLVMGKLKKIQLAQEEEEIEPRDTMSKESEVDDLIVRLGGQSTMLAELAASESQA